MGQSCPQGQSLDGGLCYQDCPKGYTAQGPYCWADCPLGRDSGLTFCTVDTYDRPAGTSKSACEKTNGKGNCDECRGYYYAKCKPGYHDGFVCTTCVQDCPQYTRDSGVRTCEKDRRDRGSGNVPSLSITAIAIIVIILIIIFMLAIFI